VVVIDAKPEGERIARADDPDPPFRDLAGKVVPVAETLAVGLEKNVRTIHVVGGKIGLVDPSQQRIVFRVQPFGDKRFLGDFLAGALVGEIQTRRALEDDEQQNYDNKIHQTNFDDFLKIMINVGQIQSCEPMEGSSKLYRLSVDFGELGKRQILSGIAKFYACEELVGRKGIFVTNLTPRKMMGTVSEGMILGASDENGTYRIAAANPRIANGTRLS